MDDAKRELVRAWLIKGHNDLITARAIGALPDAPLDTAIYHCQQGGASGQGLPVVSRSCCFTTIVGGRSHEVERLVELAKAFNPSFNAPIRRGRNPNL